MSLITVDYGNIGGGGITAYTKEGNSDDGSVSALPTTLSEVFTITTGIPKTELTRFRMVARIAESLGNYFVLTDYDKTRTNSHQMTVGLSDDYANGAVACADMASTNTSYGCVIKSISDDGVITLQSGSRTNWGSLYNYIYWQAG